MDPKAHLKAQAEKNMVHPRHQGDGHDRTDLYSEMVASSPSHRVSLVEVTTQGSFLSAKKVNQLYQGRKTRSGGARGPVRGWTRASAHRLANTAHRVDVGGEVRNGRHPLALVFTVNYWLKPKNLKELLKGWWRRLKRRFKKSGMIFRIVYESFPNGSHPHVHAILFGLDENPAEELDRIWKQVNTEHSGRVHSEPVRSYPVLVNYIAMNQDSSADRADETFQYPIPSLLDIDSYWDHSPKAHPDRSANQRQAEDVPGCRLWGSWGTIPYAPEQKEVILIPDSDYRAAISTAAAAEGFHRKHRDGEETRRFNLRSQNARRHFRMLLDLAVSPGSAVHVELSTVASGESPASIEKCDFRSGQSPRSNSDPGIILLLRFLLAREVWSAFVKHQPKAWGFQTEVESLGGRGKLRIVDTVFTRDPQVIWEFW